MKNILFNIGLMILFSCTSVKTKNDALIKFRNTEYDLGTIPVNKEVEYIFEFTNPGQTPLIVSNVKTSCGCTVADWTKKPVKPGANGVITISYDADFPGTFNKTIMVHFNGEDSPVTLNIKGRVEYPQDLEKPTE